MYYDIAYCTFNILFLVDNIIGMVELDLVKVGDSDIGPIDTYKRTTITSATLLNTSKILLSLKGTRLPLVIKTINDKYELGNDTKTVNNLSNVDIKYVSKFINSVILIPRNNFKFIYITDPEIPNSNIYDLIKTKDTLKYLVINAILSSSLSLNLCKAPECYNLVGGCFHNLLNINVDKTGDKMTMFVQSICSHNKRNRKLFVISHNIDYANMTLEPIIELLSEYDLYHTFRLNGLDRTTSSNLVVVGCTIFKNDGYILATYNDIGYILSLKYYPIMKMLSTTIQFVKINNTDSNYLTNKPVSISFIDANTLIIICTNINTDDKYAFKYYILKVKE
jgi:hypothetical protein